MDGDAHSLAKINWKRGGKRNTYSEGLLQRTAELIHTKSTPLWAFAQQGAKMHTMHYGEASADTAQHCFYCLYYKHARNKTTKLLDNEYSCSRHTKRESMVFQFTDPQRLCEYLHFVLFFVIPMRMRLAILHMWRKLSHAWSEAGTWFQKFTVPKSKYYGESDSNHKPLKASKYGLQRSQIPVRGHRVDSQSK